MRFAATQPTAVPQAKIAAPLLTVLRIGLLSCCLYVYTYPRPQPWLQAALVAGMTCWIAWKVVRRQPLASTPLTLPLIATLGVTTIATAFSIDPRVSLTGLINTLLLLAAFFLFCDLLAAQWSPALFIDALLLVVSALLIQGVWAIGQWHWQWYTLRVPEYATFPSQYRLFDLAIHPNMLAALINLTWPFAVMRLVQTRRRQVQIGWCAWLLTADVVLFFCRSRGGWIAASIGLVLVVTWQLSQHGQPDLRSLRPWIKRTWRIWATAAGYLAVFCGLVIVTSVSAKTYEYGGSIATGAGRFLFWQVAWNLFLDHPLVGSGPLTYPQFYVTHVASDRTWIADHAHNLYLDTLGQQGLAGGIALVWVVFVGVRSMIRGWRMRVAQRPLLVAIGVAFTSFFVHSVFDVLSWLPFNALLIMLLSALALHDAGLIDTPRWRLPRRAGVILAAPLVLLYVVSHQQVGAAALDQALYAGQAGAWPAASAALDRAVAADPQFAFLYGQRGYAYGVQALPATGRGDPAALRQALENYAIAQQLEPSYVPHLVNHAALLDQIGRADAAEQLLQQAAAQKSQWALPALLLAERFSARGDSAAAQALYRDAFRIEPDSWRMAVCQRSFACRSAASLVPPSTDAVASAHHQIQTLIKQGTAQQALDLIDRSPAIANNVAGWLDRSEAYLTLGELPQARYTLQLATEMDTPTPATSTQAALLRARLASVQNQPDAAITALESVVRPPVVMRPYDYQVFSRFGLPGVLLPPVDLLTRTSDDLEVYRQLAYHYAAQGRATDAAWANNQYHALSVMLP